MRVLPDCADAVGLSNSGSALANRGQRSEQKRTQGAGEQGSEHEPKLGEMILQREEEAVVLEPLLRIGHGLLNRDVLQQNLSPFRK